MMKTNNYIILGLLALGFMACEMRDELKKLPSKEDQQEEGWFTLDVVSNGQNQTTKAAFDSKDVDATLYPRSEERRVGKEGRSRWSPYH